MMQVDPKTAVHLENRKRSFLLRNLLSRALFQSVGVHRIEEGAADATVEVSRNTTIGIT